MQFVVKIFTVGSSVENRIVAYKLSKKDKKLNKS